MLRRRHARDLGREWEGDRRSWFIRSCLPPEAEFLRIEKIGRVNLVVEWGVSRRITFLRTSFALLSVARRPLFGFLAGPELPYHNNLYDTRVVRTVNVQLAETGRFVKGGLFTGAELASCASDDPGLLNQAFSAQGLTAVSEI